MERNDYSLTSIHNLIDLNTKLLDEKEYYKTKCEELNKTIKDLKYCFSYKLNEGIEYIKVKEVIDIIKELENNEENILNNLL